VGQLLDAIRKVDFGIEEELRKLPLELFSFMFGGARVGLGYLLND
jgi:hypothetical protein